MFLYFVRIEGSRLQQYNFPPRQRGCVCFFSLSGFLIIKQLYDEKNKIGRINLKSFFTKRVLRIFPLYYLVLIFGFLYYRCILPYFGFEVDNDYHLLNGILLSVTFFSNIFFTYSPGGILEILWSIGIEEQFYLMIAPILFILPIKKIISFLIAFTGIYFFMYFSENLLFLKKFQMFFFYFSFSGMMAIFSENLIFKRIVRKIRFLILLLFILYFTTPIFSDYLPDFFYHLFSMILFGLTLVSLSYESIKVLDSRVMNYLGKISYGIYMYHAIVLQFVGLLYLKFLTLLKINGTVLALSIYLLVIFFTVVVAHFSFKYYESYFFKLKRKMI